MMKFLMSLIFGKESKEYEYKYIAFNCIENVYPLLIDGWIANSYWLISWYLVRLYRPKNYNELMRISIKIDLMPSVVCVKEKTIVETPGYKYANPIKIEGVLLNEETGIYTLRLNNILPEIFNIKLDHLIICNQNTHRYDNN